jgi:hypothetical protein
MRNLAGAIVGALVALAYGDYHNEHVNALVGGWVFSGDGFKTLAVIGAVAGFVLVALWNGTIRTGKSNADPRRSWWR